MNLLTQLLNSSFTLDSFCIYVGNEHPVMANKVLDTLLLQRHMYVRVHFTKDKKTKRWWRLRANYMCMYQLFVRELNKCAEIIKHSNSCRIVHIHLFGSVDKWYHIVSVNFWLSSLPCHVSTHALPPPPPHFWDCTLYVTQNCRDHSCVVLISHVLATRNADSKVSVHCTSKQMLSVPWYWSIKSSVGMELRYGLDDQRNRVLFPIGVRYFRLLHSVKERGAEHSV
jgi:hypothetical protein